MNIHPYFTLLFILVETGYWRREHNVAEPLGVLRESVHWRPYFSYKHKWC